MNSNKPASRKKARRFAIQALYGWSISGNDINEIETFFLIQHSNENFNREYFHQLLFDITHKVTIIDDFMKCYLDRKLEDLDYIERSILRLAVYELQYQPELPFRIIINEALELAKTFGAKESYKYVNGVLDKMARDIRKEEK